jgi:hypothetical protein
VVVGAALEGDGLRSVATVCLVCLQTLVLHGCLCGYLTGGQAGRRGSGWNVSLGHGGDLGEVRGTGGGQGGIEEALGLGMLPGMVTNPARRQGQR